MADNQAYNSKNLTQNVTYAPSTGGTFDGTYLSSKGGSGLAGPTQAQAGKDGSSGGVQSSFADVTGDVREPLPVLRSKLRALCPSAGDAHPADGAGLASNEKSLSCKLP